MNIFFTEEELLKLETYVNDTVVTKYGRPILNYLDEIKERRSMEESQKKIIPPSPPEPPQENDNVGENLIPAN